MKYIYDIVLNFQNNYYEFYEWKRKDNIKNITRIPIYRVSSEDILILKSNKIKISSSFLNRIKEDNKKYKKIICLVSNTKVSIGLLFDDKGNLLKRSSLIYEEEDEVNDISKDLDITKIEYIENEEKLPTSTLRIDIERKESLADFIDNTNDLKILKYLYYEYFYKECNNIQKIKKELKKEIDKDWTKKQKNLYHTISLLNKKNLPIK